MLPRQPIAAEVAARIATMPVALDMGIEILAAAEGRSELTLPVKHSLTFDGRAVQAGPVATLADFAGGTAAGSLLPEGWKAATADFTIKFLAPALGQHLVARGATLQAGKAMSVARADVFAVDQGRETLCATALVTLRNIAPRAADRPAGTSRETEIARVRAAA